MRVDAFAMNVKYQIKRKKSVNLKNIFLEFAPKIRVDIPLSNHNSRVVIVLKVEVLHIKIFLSEAFFHDITAKQL